MPVWKLLGAGSGVVPTYASGFLWRHYDLDALATTASDLAAQGFTAMKFRMGSEKTAADELARLRVMREAVGDGVDLMVDINQGWDVNRAIAVGRGMAEYGLFWLEDPTHFQDYAGLARIADALDTPIAAGEYHYGIEPFRHMLEARSIDIVMVDLLRVGGITQWMKVAHMAEAYNLPVVTHLAPEVLGHALAAAPNGQYVEHMPWAFALFEEVPQINAAGRLVMPDAPGLGLRFDEGASRVERAVGVRRRLAGLRPSPWMRVPAFAGTDGDAWYGPQECGGAAKLLISAHFQSFPLIPLVDTLGAPPSTSPGFQPSLE